jgi:gliding motility-associated-like protein
VKTSGTQSNGSSSANLSRSAFVPGTNGGGQLLVTGFADTTVCKGAILRYNCGFSPATHDFSWALNDKAIDGNAVSAIQVQTSRLNPGTHRLSLLVKDKGNARIVHVANATITVVEAPVIRGNKELCAYDKAKLTSGPRNPYWEYLWSTGEQTHELTVTRSGKYWLTIRVKGGDCTVTDTFDVRVMPKPLVNLGSDRTICGGDRITLGVKNPSGDYDVRWTPGGFTGNEMVFMHEKPGIYRVKVEVTGCSVLSDEIVIHVTDCKLEIPNVFTPNGDGRNDLFLIKGLEQYPGSRLIVTDRNGQVVFETSDYGNDWDGSNQPNGTYFYVLYPGGSQESYRKGSVMILR